MLAPLPDPFDGEWPAGKVNRGAECACKHEKVGVPK
jgi:hypothetical protein